MKNFDWTQFTRRVAVKAPMADLYNAWTKPAELEKWFLREANFTDTNGKPVPRETNVKATDVYGWKWYNYEPEESGKITQANGRDALQFTFAGECPVDVTLTQVGDSVLVALKQSGIPSDDESRENIRLGCDRGWSFFLVNLKAFYEGGLDLRNKSAEIKGVLNG